MGGMGGPPMGGPMGAPQMGGAQPGPPMNVQPGANMGGGMPFGASPNTTMTTMNTSTMSTTAPAMNGMNGTGGMNQSTTLMVSNNTMASSQSVVPHMGDPV